jgi:hypothetical protein
MKYVIFDLGFRYSCGIFVIAFYQAGYVLFDTIVLLYCCVNLVYFTLSVYVFFFQLILDFYILCRCQSNHGNRGRL